MTQQQPPIRGFDPQRDVLLDARNLRGLAHPLRVKLLGLLREEGPATATMLAERLGESSAATSYHLRQLAEYGFIVDEAGRGSGRERWWRSAHRSTHFDPAEHVAADTELMTTEYLRSVARAIAARTEAWVDGFATTSPEWRDAATISDYGLELTPEETKELIARIEEVALAFRDKAAEPRDARARRVVLQFQVLPGPRETAADAGIEMARETDR